MTVGRACGSPARSKQTLVEAGEAGDGSRNPRPQLASFRSPLCEFCKGTLHHLFTPHDALQNVCRFSAVAKCTSPVNTRCHRSLSIQSSLRVLRVVTISTTGRPQTTFPCIHGLDQASESGLEPALGAHRPMRRRLHAEDDGKPANRGAPVVHERSLRPGRTHAAAKALHLPRGGGFCYDLHAVRGADWPEERPRFGVPAARTRKAEGGRNRAREVFQAPHAIT